LDRISPIFARPSRRNPVQEICGGIRLNAPPNLEEFLTVYENYIARFGLDRDDPSSNSDLIKERFYIARGEQVLGEFGRIAIADNLSGQLFQPDDLYWSDELQQWQPLSCLPVAALRTKNP